MISIMDAEKFRKKVKNVIIKVGAVLFWVLLWQILYLAVGQEILIVSPIATVKRLFELSLQEQFWITAFSSLVRIMGGYVLAVIIGFFLAFLTSFVPVLRALFHPVIIAARATPVASFIILALVWLSVGKVPAFIASLVAVPIVWENISEGIRRTDEKYLQMAKVYKIGKVNTFTKIYFPSVYPYLASGAVSALGLAWKAGIAAEVLSVPKNSIGLELYYSKIYIETLDLFAWTLAVIILSVALEKLLKYLLRRISSRYNIRRKEN